MNYQAVYKTNNGFFMRRSRGQTASVVYWPAVLFVLVFSCLSEEGKLALVVIGTIFYAVKTRGRIELRFPPYSAFLLVPVVSGLIAGLANGQVESSGYYTYLRDCVYYFAPFLVWVFGLALGNNISSENKLWTTLFVMGFAVSAQMIIGGLFSLREESMALRTFEPNEFCIYPLALFFLSPKSWVWRDAHKRLSVAMVVVSLIAMALSLSRTTILCLLILLLVIALKSLKRVVQVICVLLACLLCFVAVLNFLPSALVDDYVNKIQNSFSEISANRSLWTTESINQNWRGYEVRCATDAFTEADAYIQAFGFGFGYLLDVGGYGNLVGVEGGGIPFLHNGYYGVLIKSGVAGLMGLLVFLVGNAVKLMARWLTRGEPLIGLAAGTVICLLFCTSIIQGIFLPSALYYFTIPLSFIYQFIINNPIQEVD